MNRTLYLAGPSAELPLVLAAVAAARAAGWTVVSTWHDTIAATRQGRPTDDGTPREVLAEAWWTNTAEIDDADRVVALCRTGGGLSDGTREEVAYRSALIPIGSAECVVVGDPYPSLAGLGARCVATLEEALRP
jgi:hypothetical protein